MITAINVNVIDKTQDYKKLNSMFQNFDLTPNELLDHIRKGHAFCTCQLKEKDDGYCDRKNENFVNSSIVAIDIDNSINVVAGNETSGKMKVPDNEYLTYKTIIQDDFIRQNASFVYTTVNHTDAWNRFRIVFLVKYAIDNPETHKILFQALNSQYLGDEATSASAQAFFGSSNSEFTFFGNVLDNETINNLINEYQSITEDKSKKNTSDNVDSSMLSKDEMANIVKYIFKNGKIPNHQWWKVPTILKNTGVFTDNEIHQLIQESVGDTGDVDTKLRIAHRFKDKLTVATLIYYARLNGYELPESIRSSSKLLEFWQITERISRSGENKISANISYNLFNKFLANNGYRILEHEKGYQLINIDQNNQIDYVSELNLRQFVFNFIRNTDLLTKQQRFIIEEQMQKNSNHIFSVCIMNLPVFNDELKKYLVYDDNGVVYFFYKNGFRKITKESDEFLDYSKLQGFIWKKSVLNRNFNKSDNGKSEFEHFIRCVCSVKGDDGSVDFNENKYQSLCSCIGYLLSRYKKRTETIGIVLCDEVISDNPEGGSGKSIATEALGRMRNLTTIDGRFFDPNSQFRFETVNESSEIINLDDCSQKFAFDKLFHAITGDITVERKGVSRFTIPFDLAPKLCFSTNHIFSGAGNSHERRIFEIEFSPYFNSKHKPIDEFGHCLFDDWEQEEWNKFDDFMASCVQLYLKKGIIKYKQVNLDWKKLVENTSPLIAEYVDNYLKPNIIYRGDSVQEDLNRIMKTHYYQSTVTKSVHYWAEQYKKLFFYSEFNKKLDSTIYVISTEKNKKIDYFKRQDQFASLCETGKLKCPSDQVLEIDDFFKDL